MLAQPGFPMLMRQRAAASDVIIASRLNCAMAQGLMGLRDAQTILQTVLAIKGLGRGGFVLLD